MYWATCNIGAETGSDQGDLFAWGEIEPKDEYTIDNSKTYGKDISDWSGDPEYDAATAIWGAPWRTPTLDEIKELDALEGVAYGGYRIVGTTGEMMYLSSGYDGGYFWSSTPYDSEWSYCYDYYYEEGNLQHREESLRKYNGFPIRPVRDK